MSKKFTREELNKIVEEWTTTNSDFDFNILGPAKERRKSLKTLDEKVNNYNSLIIDSVFWASKQAYLEILKSFLLKKIDASTLTSKFFQLRVKDIIRADELCAIIEDQILPIPDLYYTFKAKDFNSTMSELDLEIDRFDPDIEDDVEIEDLFNPNLAGVYRIVYGEKSLRWVIQKEFLPILQKACDFNDSVVQPKLD